MAENRSHKYTSLTDLLDTAQMKADPAVVLVDDDDGDHTSSDDDDYSSYIISNNNSSSIWDPFKAPLPPPTLSRSPLYDHDDDHPHAEVDHDHDVHDCSNHDDDVKKNLSENNNNCGTCVYDEGKTSFIPKTVFLPHDNNIMASSSSSSSGERTPADNPLLS